MWGPSLLKLRTSSNCVENMRIRNQTKENNLSGFRAIFCCKKYHRTDAVFSTILCEKFILYSRVGKEKKKKHDNARFLKFSKTKVATIFNFDAHYKKY